MDHSCFGLAVLVQTTRNMLDLFKCVHLCRDQLHRAYSTGIFLVDSKECVHKCTRLLGIFELLLWLGCDILEVLDKCLKSFSMPRKSSRVKTLWNSRHMLSPSIRKCYCLRYLQAEKRTFPVVALQYKPGTCMHESKQAEGGSAAVCSFFLQCKVRSFLLFVLERSHG